MFRRMGDFLFWLILPYLVAVASMIIHKRLSASKDPRKEALVLGRVAAGFTRSIMGPAQAKKT